MKTRHGRGLFIVVVTFALAALVAVALRGRSVDRRLKAHHAAMKSDLIHLREFQQQYRSEHGRYTADVDSTNVRWSDGVLLVDLSISADGWMAIVRHTAAPGACFIEVSATNPGAPECR